MNTTLDPDHIGGNEPMSFAGRTVNGNPAAIIAHEKLPLRMVKLPGPVPDSARPAQHVLQRVQGFLLQRRRGVRVSRAAHTDGDTIVYFRHSDVIAAGDTFVTTTYPSDRPRRTAAASRGLSTG